MTLINGGLVYELYARHIVKLYIPCMLNYIEYLHLTKESSSGQPNVTAVTDIRIPGDVDCIVTAILSFNKGIFSKQRYINQCRADVLTHNSTATTPPHK